MLAVEVNIGVYIRVEMWLMNFRDKSLGDVTMRCSDDRIIIVRCQIPIRGE